MQLFLYLGPEEFRKRETIGNILQKNQLSTHELQSYHASSVKLDEIQNLLLAPPLFGGNSAVLLSDINLLSAKDQKRLADLCILCRKAQVTQTFFFLSSKEYKISAVLAKVFPKSEQKIFWELSEEEKKRHIAAFCRKHGKEIEPSAIEVLLERVSDELVTLEGTLETVFLYLYQEEKKKSKQTISEDLLTQIFTQSRDATIYDLFRYMAERNLARSLQVVESLLLQGSSKAASLIMQLVYQWDKLLQIKERMRFDSFEDACAEEYVRTKSLKTDMRRGIEKYSLNELRKVQQINQDYNLSIKSGANLQELLLKHYVYIVIQIQA